MGSKICTINKSEEDREKEINSNVAKKGYTISDKIHSQYSIANKVTQFKYHKSKEKNNVQRALTVNDSNMNNKQSKSIKSSASKEFQKKEETKSIDNPNKLKINTTDIVERQDSLGSMGDEYYKEKIVAVDLTKFKIEKVGHYSAQYEIVGSLGKGSYGEVNKVKHKVNGKIFAMKTIPKNLCIDEKQVLPEIEILKSLDHHNIVRLYEYFQDSKNYYLITEYIH